MITPETASQALSSWLAYLQISEMPEGNDGVKDKS